MVRKMLPLGMVMLLLFASAAWSIPEVPVEFLYNGNVDPEAANSAGTGLNFRNHKDVDGMVVYDPDAIDRLAFLIVDDTNTSECGSGLRAFYALEPDCEIEDATIVGRIKTTYDEHVTMDCPPVQADVAAGNLGILDPISLSPYSWGSSACLHWGGANGHLEDIWRNQGTTVSGDANYHVFRLTIEGRNGGVTSSWSDNFDSYANLANLVGQDSWTGTAGSEISIENPTGTAGNVLLTAGANLTTASQVFAGGIGADLSGKITCEFRIQAATSDPSGNMWKIAFNNGGLNLAMWYGGLGGARARVDAPGGGAGNTTPLTAGVWTTLKVEIKPTQTDFYVDGVFFQTIAATSRTVLLTTVTIQHENRADLPGQQMRFDDFSVAGAITIDPPERIVRVYKDENLIPVLVINNAAEVDSADIIGSALEGFMFGTDDTIALQTIRFDWVSGSNQGAFAPGAEVAVLGHSLVPTAETQDIAKTIDDCKTKADGISVVIPGAVVAASFIDDNYMSWFFGLEKSDRSAGIRVISIDTAIPSSKVNIWGVLTTTPDGERVIQAMYVSEADPGPFDIPLALCMTNKASGGSAFGAQGAVRSYGTRPWPWTSESFDYPTGKLAGNGSWTGDTDANQIAVSGGVVQFHHNYPGDTVSRVSFDPLPTSYRISVNAKQGDAGFVSANDFWAVIIKSNESAHREIGRWQGYRDRVVPRRDDAGGYTAGPSQALTTNYQKLTIEFTPAKLADQPDGDHSNVVNFLVDDVPLWTWTYYSGPTTSPRYPFSITLQNQAHGAPNSNYVELDDFALENLQFDPVPAGVPAVGLNNVGLLVRLYGKVIRSYFDLLAPSFNTSYFEIDDGSGILLEPDIDGTHLGIRCAAPNTLSAADVPAVDSYVSAYGILGMRNGQRYLYTLSWDAYP